MTFKRTLLLLAVLIVLTAGEAAVIIGPNYEGQIWPISEARPVNIEREGRLIRYYQEVHKFRDCSVLSARYFISQVESTVQAEVTVINEFNVPVGTINRPVGPATYGPYRFMLPALGFDGPFNLRSVFLESCHPGWLTIHRLGPFAFPGQ